MTIQKLIERLQEEVELHAQGAVKKPMTLDSQVIFQDPDGNELNVGIDTAGGNAFDPAIIITVY